MIIAIKRRALRYFKYEGFLVFNPESKNLIGIDFLPRYRVLPTKLLELLSVSKRRKSVDFGYKKDASENLYFKNVEMSEMEALVEFQYISNSPPFGFEGENDYIKYVTAVFDETYQSRLEKLYAASLRTGVIPIAENGESKIKIIDFLITPLEFFKEKEFPSKKNLNLVK